MQILKDDRQENTVSLEIQEDYAKFKDALEVNFTKASREIKIPGFRPGKAPRAMVEKVINWEIIESHSAQDLISDLYPQILQETKIEPVDYPKIEIKQLEKEKPFVFSLTVDVYPTVKLGEYAGISLEKDVKAVSEEEILKTLGQLQERFAITGADGKKELLPLDDEFAKKASQYGTLAEFKEEIRRVMQDDKKERIEAELRDHLIAQASAASEVTIPNGLVEREINLMVDELGNSLARYNLSMENYLKGMKKELPALREEMRSSAQMRAKGKIVLRAIAQKEQIKVTSDDLEEEFKNLSRAYQQTLEEFKKTLTEGAREYIEDYLLRRKALDFLLEKAIIKEVAA